VCFGKGRGRLRFAGLVVGVSILEWNGMVRVVGWKEPGLVGGSNRALLFWIRESRRVEASAA
jgi:hypothetical protein